MPRTTVDIDAPILKEVKALQKREKRSLGQVVSQLLREALTRRVPKPATPALTWTSRPMRPLIDVSDKDALYAVLDKEHP
jgi:hypothetical protein